MNFFDAYDVPTPGTPPPREGPEPTLNEEVTQVVGQLSRLWGGFRKQSQTVLETARKDLGQVVSQAQKELTKLTTDDPHDASTDNVTSTAETAPEGSTSAAAAAERSVEISSPGEDTSSTNTEDPETPTDTSRPTHARGASVSAAAQNIFSRIQASLPANLASTVQAQLPESLRQGAGSIDLGQLRTTLTTEFQRVQGVTRAQAEEYVHRSEDLLREASEFIKDAVKVVPPEEGESDVNAMWDGTDVWMLPSMSDAPDAKEKGKERRSVDGRTSGEVLRAGATRAQALLTQLKHDPEVIKVDPAADSRVKEMWEEWVKKEVDSQEHGILSEKWTEALHQALRDSQDGDALQRTMETLTSSTMTSETFWTRYFFRVHQVEVEEERRKALIQGTVESEEDINWESDDDETADSTAGTAAPAMESMPTAPGLTAHLAQDASHETIVAAKSMPSVASTPASASPRLSSEGSYDVVSSQVSNAGDVKPVEGHKKDDGDEGDSDWE